MAFYKVRIQLPGSTSWKTISEFGKKGGIVAFPDQELTAAEARELIKELEAQRPDCEFQAWPTQS